MGTPFETIFNMFLARIDDIDLAIEPDEEVVNAELGMLLKMAIFDFRFPKISLEIDEDTSSFVEDLTNNEVQVLATIMKVHWLRRQVNTWRLIKQQYTDKDFALSSQANHLAQLIKSLESAEKEQIRALDTYGRKGFNFGSLAGGVR